MTNHDNQAESEADAQDRSESQRTPSGLEPIAIVVAFDFTYKTAPIIKLEDAKRTMAEGKFVWIDIDMTRTDEAKKMLLDLGLCDSDIVEDALSREPATQLSRYEHYFHLVLTGCRLLGHRFDLERLDVIVGERYMLTIHRGQPSFLRAVRKDYHNDFVRFAHSPSFLLYEMWDHLIDNYLQVHNAFEDRVEAIQRALIDDVDESVFSDASELGSDLLHLRKVVLPARAVLTDLSTRKSAFVSESTQPFLANMAGTVERVLQDVLVDRDILSDAINNHMSIVAHRTNKVMSKLTVVSVIFLPLTFLCGVYGMNFEVIPELKYEWGYYGFWGVVVVVVIGLFVVMRRIKLI